MKTKSAPQNRSKQERKAVIGKPFKPGQSGNPATQFKPGQSGNPSGKPKNEVSLTFWANEILAMTPQQAAEICKQWAKELAKYDTGGLPLAAALMMRVVVSLMNEPSPGLFKELWERIDGTVETKGSIVTDAIYRVIYEGEDDDRRL